MRPVVARSVKARSVKALPLAMLLVLVGGCGGAEAPASAPPRLASPPVKAEAAPQPEAVEPPVDLSALPEATTFGDVPGAVPDPAPQSPSTGVVLNVQQDIPVYTAAHGTAAAKLPATQLGSPTWVPVIAQDGGWAQVLLPTRPNGSTGWVRVGGSPVRMARSPYVVDVDIDAKRLVVHQGDHDLGVWTVGVGKPGTPTPRGRTYIMASVQETVTHFSPVILPLGTHSQTFNSYGGGPGTVALHGWPDPSVFGTASSDGCVRVPPDALRLLTTLPLGTLVVLR